MDHNYAARVDRYGEGLTSNTIPGTVTKMLTLLPILAAVYYYDFPKFWTALASPATLAIFVMALSLLLFGVALKRKILAVRLELSGISFGWGLLLLLLAVVLYVYGSYSSETVWFHYESLYVLILAYIALRIGKGILRALAPLLAIFGFSFLPLGLYPDFFHRELIVLLSVDLAFFLFMIYVGFRIRAAIISTSILFFGLLFSSAYLLSARMEYLYLDVLIPLPLLLLLVPRIRRFIFLPSRAPDSTCSEHHLMADGFCSICGLKLAKAKATENFGLWGLVAVAAVAALILLPSVPVLALTNNVPHDARYSPSGYSATVTPATPSGWQVNSTALYKNETDVYAIRQVYVPLYHPEIENYTMYYEVSSLLPVSNGPTGGDIPNYNRTSNVLQQFGPFQGYLTTYTASGVVLLSYQGTTSMLFLTSSGFQQYYVGVGFTREFKNTNITSDTSQFLGDLSALWLPLFTADVAYSGWTSTLFTLDQGALEVGSTLILLASVVGIAWFAYRASRSDDRLDRFLTIASTQPEEYWSYLSRLLSRSHFMGTGEELLEALPSAQARDTERVDSSLRELQRRSLVRPSLVERGADIISVWRPDT